VRFFLRLVVSTALVAAVSGCNSSSTAPSSTAPFSSVDLTVGSGATAAAGNVLTVNYTGWIYDPSKVDKKGLVFDSSVGKTPFTFTLGSGSVIPGWDKGLAGMKVGGVRRLVIPPSLAYGAARNNSIPPYATLLFDIELIDVQAQSAS
jgi:FKBP-type peptidyl-prolyl cis-trans isomerase FkpA